MEVLFFMSNKNSKEFDFSEAKLVKETELFRDCTNVVVGKGNTEADILFVGEAPGRKEDEVGEPFVGAAGKNLDKLLLSVGLSLDDIYVANILKCRPPENRDPLPEEIAQHTPWLLKQIRDMKPKVVCSLGNYATKFFMALGEVGEMKKMPGITQVHGKVQDCVLKCRGVPIKTMESATRIVSSGHLEGEEERENEVSFKLIPLFHPAAIIYNRTKLTPLWEADMEIVKREVGKV